MSEDKVELERLSIPYNDNGFMEEFKVRKVRVRERITNSFVNINAY
jgi:hypothetical protein